MVWKWRSRPSVTRPASSPPAMDDINEEEHRGLGLLTVEFEAARRQPEDEYQRLLQRPIAAGGIPQIVVRRGPLEQAYPTSARGVRGVPRAIYHRLFGQLPRVRPLHPYWAAMRHVVRI